MNVLIADDDESTTLTLSHALEAFGYSVTVAHDGLEAIQLLRSGRYRMLISDWQMPGMSGPELCREIRQRHMGRYVYIILLTSFSGSERVIEGLEAGADDFIAKPFNPSELRVRVRAGERLLGLETRELTIFALAKLAESRDQETGEHLERMREYSRVIAEDLSHTPDFRDEIDGEYIRLLYLTSPLHDIGKVAIPDTVLLKPGRLTAEEFEVMKTHTLLGAKTLEDVAASYPGGGFLKMARDIALTHHERYDGKGYPHGISGDEIPLAARITSVADVYDALTSKRVYKEAFTHELAREIIEDGTGTQFDPRVVASFVRCEDEILAIKNRFHDGYLGQEPHTLPSRSVLAESYA